MRSSGLAKVTSRFLILTVLVAASTGAFSQTLNIHQTSTTSSTNGKWDVGLNLGLTQFYGDVSSHTYFKKLSGESRIGVQVYAKRMFNPAVGIGVGLFSTGIKSIKDRNKGQVVSYNLGGNYDDLTVFAYANFNNLFGSYDENRRLSVYGTLGLGVSTWNTALTNNITGAVVHSGSNDGTRTYASKAMCVPLGLGLDYKINDRWSVHAAGTFTTVLSDDLDLWHDGAKYDQLFYTHVGVSYYLKPGHGNFLKKKKNREKENIRKRPIPIFDYMVNPNPGPAPVDSMKNKKLDLLKIPAKKTSGKKLKSDGLQFRVQIAASKNILDPNLLKTQYKLDNAVKVVHQHGYYLYSVGNFVTYQDALAGCRRILAKGVHGAFVTAYLNNQRVVLTNKMMQKGYNYQQKGQDNSPVIF